jgi:hypothetical protein
MTPFYKTSKIVTLFVFCMLLLMCRAAYAQDGNSSVSGKKFKAFIYSPQADKVSISITFQENLTMLIDVYDGFGAYVPVGPAFAGIFSAPHYKQQDNLLLFLSGIMVMDFLGGAGVSLVNFEFAGIFVFFGYIAL